MSHPCCADRTQLIDVAPDTKRLELFPGQPKPARFHIVGAPSPDLKVLVDSVYLALVSNLAEHEVSTESKPDREVKVSVGNRSGMVKLQAGRDVPVDYLRHLTDGAP